jgi:putative ABC transport system permease protein
MISYFLHIAFRHFRKNAIYPVISTVCLIIGIAIALLTFVYLKNELSFDRFHAHAPNIYRVASLDKEPNGQMRAASVRVPVGPALKETFPEIENMVRLSNSDREYLFYPDEKASPLKNILFTDTSIFSVFSFPLIYGDQTSCLQNPNSLVISQKTSKIWFGNVNPVGKTIRSNKKMVFTITGVAQDPPVNSHIQFSALIPLSILLNDSTIFKQFNGGLDAYTYLLLKPGTDIKSLEAKFVPLMWEKVNKDYAQAGLSETLYLQPLLKIHLESDTDYELQNKGNKTALIVLVMVGLVVLVLGCINFFNLATLQTISRMKDTAIRKIGGANWFLLSMQFITESILITTISLLLGIAVAELCLPFFNNMVDSQVKITYSWDIIILCLGIILIPGIIIGTTTASRFARLNPVAVLRKEVRPSHGVPVLRDVLVIVQFVVTIILFICTGLMTRQIGYILHKDLGFDKKNVMVVPLSGNLQKKATLFRDEVTTVSGVRKVSLVTEIPGWGYTSNGYKPEGNDQVIMIHALGVDENFFEAMRIPVVSGKMFKDNEPADHMVFVINETLAHLLGWKNSIGKTIERNGVHQVVGVCKDFHYASLRDQISPLVIAPIPTSDAGGNNFMLVSFETKDLQTTLKGIQAIWNKEEQAEPFNSFFLDEQFASIYESETHQRNLFMVFSILAIVIAGLGLFSISIFSLTSRTKEIGIRKVSGARAIEILFLINKSFIIWIAIAFVLACPVAYYLMHQWMQGFAYKTNLGWGLFAIAGLLTLFIALLTVSWQAWRAASRNPVEALRYE